MASRKKGGLGRGLDALIPPAAVKTSEDSGMSTEKDGKTFGTEPEITEKETYTQTEISVQEKQKETAYPVRMVKLTAVEPDKNQPRHRFDEDKLQELAESIRSKGLLEPILVQDCSGHYEIIAGERRWRACRLAGIKEIPVMIRSYDEQERIEISLIENIQRENLNPIEEAQAYQKLIKEFHLTQDEVARKVSKNRASIANSIRLLRLAEPVQQMVIEGTLSMGQARALVAVEEEKPQKELAEKTAREKLSVREVEKLVRNYIKNKEAAPKKIKESNTGQKAIYRDLEEKMNSSLGMKVSIRPQGEKSGRLEIVFAGQDDLEKLMDRLLG